jgi:hypothetical protein
LKKHCKPLEGKEIKNSKLPVKICDSKDWRGADGVLVVGPRFIKVGVVVRYRPEDLEVWLAGQPTGGVSPESRKAELEAVRRSA